MRKFWIVSTAVVVAGLVAGCASSPPGRVYAKPGASPHDRAITHAECRREALIAHRRTLYHPMYRNDPVAARYAAAAAARVAEDRCARSNGYRRVR